MNLNERERTENLQMLQSRTSLNFGHEFSILAWKTFISVRHMPHSSGLSILSRVNSRFWLHSVSSISFGNYQQYWLIFDQILYFQYFLLCSYRPDRSHFELVSKFLQDELDRQIIEHVFYNSLLWFIDSIIQSQVIHQVDHVFNRCFF